MNDEHSSNDSKLLRAVTLFTREILKHLSVEQPEESKALAKCRRRGIAQFDVRIVDVLGQRPRIVLIAVTRYAPDDRIVLGGRDIRSNHTLGAQRADR